jgi:hypothetical protein
MLPISTRIRRFSPAHALLAAAAVSLAFAAPAAAKTDKPKNPNAANGKYKHCDTGKRHFKCVTEDGETASGQCLPPYTVITAINAAVDVDLDGDGFVCFSATLGYADDKSA